MLVYTVDSVSLTSDIRLLSARPVKDWRASILRDHPTLDDPSPASGPGLATGQLFNIHQQHYFLTYSIFLAKSHDFSFNDGPGLRLSFGSPRYFFMRTLGENIGEISMLPEPPDFIAAGKVRRIPSDVYFWIYVFLMFFHTEEMWLALAKYYLLS